MLFYITGKRMIGSRRSFFKRAKNKPSWHHTSSYHRFLDIRLQFTSIRPNNVRYLLGRKLLLLVLKKGKCLTHSLMILPLLMKAEGWHLGGSFLTAHLQKYIKLHFEIPSLTIIIVDNVLEPAGGGAISNPFS